MKRWVSSDKLVFVAAVVLFPVVFHDEFALGAGISVAGFAVGTVGFVLLMGLAHQLAIGQAVFYMVGGYGSAILTTRYGWDGLSSAALSAVLASALAVVVGWPLLKLRGFVLAIASLALHLLFIALATLWVDVTGGAAGIPTVPHFSIGPWVIRGDLGFYFFSWLMVAGAVLVGLNIDQSRVGRALRAIAADEAGATACGINNIRYKLIIFAISAAMASVGGSIFVHYLRVVDPTVFGMQFSLDIITAVIVGGLHSVWGGVLGAGVIIVVRELLRLIEQPAWEVIVMGGLTVVVLLCFRSGIAGALDAIFASRLSARAGHLRPSDTGISTGQEVLVAASASPTDVRLVGDRKGMLLQIDRVSRHFGNLIAVSEVSFDVSYGQIVALIGPNGAGKTTLLDMISGHRALTAGSIVLQGRDVSADMPDAVAAAGVARTFQTVRLFDNMSVLENVMCGAHIFGRASTSAIALGLPRVAAEESELTSAAVEALHFVGLKHVERLKPAQLPFGHQRLMELARALVIRPQLLLLDEPASGLNDAETEEFAHLLLRLRSTGITILLVEHDIRLVMGVADKIVVLDHGEKIADGLPGAVRTNPQVISAYLGVAA